MNQATLGSGSNEGNVSRRVRSTYCSSGGRVILRRGRDRVEIIEQMDSSVEWQMDIEIVWANLIQGFSACPTAIPAEMGVTVGPFE